MRALLLLFALLLQAPAQAQPYEACLFKSLWTPFGTGTEWVRGSSTAEGVTVAWWGWWCPQSGGQWGYTLQRCVVGRACLDPAAISAELDTAARSVNPLQALLAARERLTVPVLPAEKAAWDLAEWDAVGALAPIRPPSTAYVVGPATSADGTRPAYPFANGVRGTTSSGRAAAGQPCDPAKGSLPAASGGIWAVFGPAFDPGRVALCVKR